MADTGRLMPVNPVPNPTGNVAARKVGTRWTAGHIITATAPLKPGFTAFRAHWADCSTAPKHSRAEANPLFE